MKQSAAILLALGPVFALCAQCVSADIIIDGYTDAQNDRFSNDGSFIMSGFDLSGIGQTSGGIWGTAISRNVIISAAHRAPSGTINFYPGNDPTATPVTRTITSGTTITETDIFLGVLDSNLPSNITHYSFADTAIAGIDDTLTSAGVFQSVNTFMFGLSPFDESSDVNRSLANDQAVGRNLVTGYVENINFGSDDNDSLLMFQESNVDTDFVTHEAKFSGGDSGGPTFIDNGGGDLLLIGTNAFVNSDPTPSFSGINYTGNQAAAINNFITVNAVPEPNSMVLGAIAMGAGALAARRERRLAKRLAAATQ